MTFDRHDERINAGMFAKVKLYTEDYSGAVVMPSDALVQNGDDFFAYIVNSSGDSETVSKVKVEKGKTVDGYVQILSGVKAGDKVVIQGMTSLGDGSKILDISSPKKKN